MECSWCSKKDYFVMKIPCNHHICVLCYKNQMSCNICKKQIIQNIQKKQTTEDSYVSWYDTMYDYDNGII
jgi:hypothetical protein